MNNGLPLSESILWMKENWMDWCRCAYLQCGENWTAARTLISAAIEKEEWLLAFFILSTLRNYRYAENAIENFIFDKMAIMAEQGDPKAICEELLEMCDKEVETTGTDKN